MVKEIQFINDWQSTALKLLCQQFKNKTNFNGFLSSFLQQAQILENTFKDLYTLRWLETAQGIQLDGLGQILALERNGLSDADYRDALFFQAFLNASNGQPELLITALKVFTRSDSVFIFELYPASIFGYFNNPDKVPSNLNNKMQELCAGGVRWGYAIIGNDQPFIFDELYYKPNDSVTKFGGYASVDYTGNLIDDSTCGKMTIAFN